MLHLHRRLISITLAIIFGLAPFVALAQVPAALNQIPGAGVLSQIPSSSALVIYIPKLSDANAKIGKYLKTTKLDQSMGLANGADVVSLLLKEAGLSEGIDLDGSAAFVMPNIQFMGEPRVCFILPIKDQAKFLANFASAQPVPPAPNGSTYKDVLMVKTKQGPANQTSYIKIVGNYAVFGNQAASVDKQPATDETNTLLTNAGPLGASVMASSDAILYFNMGKAGPLLQPMIAMFLANAQLQMSQNPDAAAAMGGPEMAVSTLQLYSAIINALLTQTQAIIIGTNIHDNDVTIRQVVQFKPDSALAKTFAVKTPAPVSLAKLPADRPLLFAGSFAAKAIDVNPILASLQSDIIDKMPADAPGRSMMKLYVDGIRMLEKTDDTSFVWFAPERGNPASFMNMVCVYDSKDPATLRADYRSMFTRFTNALPKAAPGQNSPAMTFTLEPDALTVADHKTDRALFTMPQPNDDPNGPGGARMRAMNPFGQMFSQPIQYLITHTDQSVILATGQQDQLEKALRAAVANTGELVKKEKLATLRKMLPADRFAEGYLDLGRYVDFITTTMMAAFTGNRPNIQTPDLSPLAFAATSDHSGGLLLTTLVANDTVAGIRDYTIALQTAMAAPAGTPVRIANTENNAGAPTEIYTVSDKEFDAKVVNAKYPVIVVFTANYSMDGKKQEKVFQDMMQQYMGDVGFARVDTGTDNLTAEKLKLDALPSTVVYANGKLITKFSGMVAKEKLIEAITPFVK